MVRVPMPFCCSLGEEEQTRPVLANKTQKKKREKENIEMKRKAKSSSFKGMVRRSPRLQQAKRRSPRLQRAKEQMDSRPLSGASSETSNSIPTQSLSLSSSSSKRMKETEITYISELRESDQNSSSNTSVELLATIDQFIGSVEVSALAQAASPAAPSRSVQSHEISGHKTEECNNTRLAGTCTDTTPASEGTSNTGNLNSKLVAQDQGRKESDQDAVPSATATIASNSIPGRQVAAEEARVIPDVMEMSKDVNNPKATDEPQRPTYSIGLTEMANMFADDDSNVNEVQSVFDPPLVSVQGYRVKEKFAPILRNVMEKYGDIALTCFMETVGNRSFFLEQICEILQTLRTAMFVDITQAEVKKMLELVVDLGRLNLDVGWLQKRLEEILEGIEVIKQSSQFKESRKRNVQIIQESEKALERYETRILMHKAQIRELEEKASLEKEKINDAKAEDIIIMERASNVKPKVKRFINESLLHDLL